MRLPSNVLLLGIIVIILEVLINSFIVSGVWAAAISGTIVGFAYVKFNKVDLTRKKKVSVAVIEGIATILIIGSQVSLLPSLADLRTHLATLGSAYFLIVLAILFYPVLTYGGLEAGAGMAKSLNKKAPPVEQKNEKA